MSSINKKKKIRASILDRLLDDDPQNNTELMDDQHQRMKDLRSSVRRDLESLLNTRYRIIKPPEQYKEVDSSLLNYGLPDLATVNISDIEKRREFTHTLEKIIKHYEPRFKDVKIQYQENKDNTDRTLKFRIDATLYADPAPEVIVFDSILEPISRVVSIKEAGRE